MTLQQKLTILLPIAVVNGALHVIVNVSTMIFITAYCGYAFLWQYEFTWLRWSSMLGTDSLYGDLIDILSQL